MTKVADQKELKIRRYTDDLQRRLIEGSLSFSELKKTVGPLIGQFHKPFPSETSHLRLIGETTISATKAGIGMKQENQTLFNSVDPDFDNWDAQTVSKDTEEAKAYVYDQMQNGTYAEIFGSFNKNLDLLEFETHEQIKDFVKNSPELLHPKGWYTHFLYKNKSGKRFVADVDRSSDGDLSVFVNRFSCGSVWSADFADRFVILATKTSEPKS